MMYTVFENWPKNVTKKFHFAEIYEVVLRTSQWTHNQPTGSDRLHSHGTKPHVKNTTKSSALEDGHKVARNMLSNL